MTKRTLLMITMIMMIIIRVTMLSSSFFAFCFLHFTQDNDLIGLAADYRREVFGIWNSPTLPG